MSPFPWGHAYSVLFAVKGVLSDFYEKISEYYFVCWCHVVLLVYFFGNPVMIAIVPIIPIAKG